MNMEVSRVFTIFVGLYLLMFVYRGETGAISLEVQDDGGDLLESLECGENEVYSVCDANPSCQKTCENIDTWAASPCIMTKDCMNGCICSDGYVRDQFEGVCIRENSCPRVRH